MFKQVKDMSGGVADVIQRLSDNAFIPFDPANSDFQRFKNDIQGLSKDFDGNLIPVSELQDADGNTMTAEEIAEFVSTLP